MAVVRTCALLGCALVSLAGCAALAGLDGIQECDTCFEEGGADGTVGGDGAGDSPSGADARDSSSTDGAVGDDGGRLDAGADGPQDDEDATQQDSSDATSGDGGAAADGSSEGGGDASASDASDAAAEAAGPCNPSSCIGGCCQGSNCVGGTADTACGLTGSACVSCSALGDTCVAGACQAPSPNCPTTCSGCCDSNDACHATPSPKDCPTSDGGVFKAGLPCEDCVAEGYPYCLHDIVAYVCSPIP